MGFYFLSDVAFPEANQMAGKGHWERNVPPSGNQASDQFRALRFRSTVKRDEM